MIPSVWLACCSYAATNDLATDDRDDGVLHVIVANHLPLSRAGMAQVIQENAKAFVVAMVGSVEAAVEAARRLNPDVVVASHSPPEFDAFQLLAASRLTPPRTRVVTITRADAPAVARALSDSGAGCVLPDTASSDSLVAAVLACGHLGVVVPWHLADDRSTRSKPYVRGLLSAREREVLQLIAEDRGAAQIASELFLSEATIRTHLARLYRKLVVSSAHGAVAEGFRRGLIR